VFAAMWLMMKPKLARGKTVCYFEIARQHFFFFRFLATSLSSPPSITTALKMYLRTQEGV